MKIETGNSTYSMDFVSLEIKQHLCYWHLAVAHKGIATQ